MDAESAPHAQYEAALIDLDGTLADTVGDLHAAVRDVCAELDLPVCDIDKVKAWTGNGVLKLLHRVVTNSRDGEAPADQLARAHEVFLIAYARHLSSTSRLYDGVADTLESLSVLGLKLACVTNKSARFTEPLLERLGILGHFSSIVSGDTLDTRKPDPGMLLHACGELGVAVNRSVMVGDSMNDVSAAANANMPVICLTYGYNHGANLDQPNTLGLTDRFADIVDIVTNPTYQ